MNNELIEINVYHKDINKMKIFIRAIFNLSNDLGYTWYSGNKIKENDSNYDEILKFQHFLFLSPKRRKMLYDYNGDKKSFIKFTINDSIKDIREALK